MFLMSKGPSFVSDCRCEMGVLCHQTSKMVRVVWPEKAHLNMNPNPCYDPAQERKFLENLLALVPICSAACSVLVHDSSLCPDF